MHKHEHHEHRGHSRQPDRESAPLSNRRRLAWVFALTAFYMIAEVVGGFLSNSLALLSDAGHMLTDVASIALAMFALWFSSRPATSKKTYGYLRLEILAALANGVTLVVISLLISYEAWQRLKTPQTVQGFEVTVIAIGGLVVNAISAYLLHSASSANLNMRGAFLHVISDMLGSVGAIIAGVFIWQFGWTITDPIISVLMCLLIIFSSWQLIRESLNILLEGTPSHINIQAVIEAMMQVRGVLNVHDLHIWTINSGNDALSAHVAIEENASYKGTLESLQTALRSKFNIGHVTIQIELLDENEPSKLYQIIGKSASELHH
ncbi:MAG: cation transporter [Acidobacteria bacterium]|nr:cation transporter [Acidobacteriota bacterium]